MKISAKNLLLLLVVALFTIPAAIIHGNLTNRWTGPMDVEPYVDSLNQIPHSIDDWHLVDELPELPKTVQTELGLWSHFNRVYENSTGKRVTVLLMVGSSGPLIRHPVEICYGNRAKQLIASYELGFEDSVGAQQLKVHRYEPKSILEDQFYVAYGFCRNGIWKAPSSPRVEYGAAPVLYKIQILTNANDVAKDSTPAYLANFAQAISGFVWP